MSQRSDPTAGIVVGALFVILGGLYLLNETTEIDISFRIILPVLLILAGLSLIVSSRLR